MMKISTVLIVCLLAALVWGGAPCTTGFKAEVTPNTAAAVPQTTAAGVFAATTSPTTLDVPALAKIYSTKNHCCAPFCCDECCDRKLSAPAVGPTTGRKAAVAQTTAAGVFAATASPTTLEVPAPAKVSPTKHHCCAPFCCDECCNRKSSAPAIRPTTGRKAAVAPTTAAATVPPAIA